MWAPTESCRTIDNANYSGGGGGEELKEGNDEVNGDVAADEGESSTHEVTAVAAQPGTDDESRATVTTRLTTKERI